MHDINSLLNPQDEEDLEDEKEMVANIKKSSNNYNNNNKSHLKRMETESKEGMRKKFKKKLVINFYKKVKIRIIAKN